MSVCLTPVGGGDDYAMPNGQWLALTALAHAFGEPVEVWNQCHDPKIYTPAELRSIARRVAQIKDAEVMLNDLADNGGAKLS